MPVLLLRLRSPPDFVITLPLFRSALQRAAFALVVSTALVPTLVQAFGFNDVSGRAKQLAAEPYKKLDIKLP